MPDRGATRGEIKMRRTAAKTPYGVSKISDFAIEYFFS